MPTENEASKKSSARLEKLDKKVEALIEWSKKYPKVEMGTYGTTKYLKQYASSEAEYESLKEQYKKMREYYNYLSKLKKEKRLPADRLEKLRNGNVRGEFGESDFTLELAKKYRISPSKINYLVGKYGNMEQFLKANQEGCIDEETISYLRENLTDIIDISHNTNPGFYSLYKFIEQRENIDPKSRTLEIVDFEELKQYIGVCLTQRESQVINKFFGLQESKSMTLADIARGENCTRQAILVIKERAIEKLRQAMVTKKISKFGKYCLDENRRQKIEDVIYNSNAIFIPDEEYKNEPCDISTPKYRKIIGNVTIGPTESISAIELSVRTYNALIRVGIDTVQKLMEASDSMLLNVRNLGPKALEEVLAKKSELINKYGYKKVVQNTPLEELRRIDGTYNILMRMGIDTVEKLVELDEQTLLNYKNIGPKKTSNILEMKEQAIIFLRNKKMGVCTLNNYANAYQEEASGKTELGQLRERKSQLSGEQEGLKHQLEQAKSLLDSYEAIRGDVTPKETIGIE